MESPTPTGKARTWAIVESRGQQFAVDIHCLREFVVMPEVAAIPGCDTRHRGVINLRGEVLPLLDLRKCLGWQSVPEETEAFNAMMAAREQDHSNWLDALERAVRERTEFQLATDPHQCAFGRWYYSYRSDSPWIAALLKKFEKPHNLIHASAQEALALVAVRRFDEAVRLVERKREGELREMIGLFQSLKDLMRESLRELAMVMRDSQRSFAVAVEAALAVESVASEMIQDIDAHTVGITNGRVQRVLERCGSRSLAIILDPEMLSVQS